MRRERLASAAAALASLAALVACEPTNQGYAPRQPIAFSHAVHAGANQVPCEYCHYQAERGRYAGIPPTQVCLNCHERVLPDRDEIRRLKAAVVEQRPIEWVRVHALPDHVAFEHRPHVAAGVACQTCHGPIQEMARVPQEAPLTMGWCLSCHRKGSLRGGGLTPIPAAQANRLTDCAVCHH